MNRGEAMHPNLPRYYALPFCDSWVVWDSATNRYLEFLDSEQEAEQHAAEYERINEHTKQFIEEYYAKNVDTQAREPGSDHRG